MLEVPSQKIETLRGLPVQVTWSDEGLVGSFFGGGFRNQRGEFFSIDLQGQSYDQLSDYNDSPVLNPDNEYLIPPATFSGSIEYGEYNGIDIKYLQAGTLTVEDDFRQNRLGERLSHAMAYIAIEQGCQAIKVSFSHPAALKIFRKIFGDERMHITKKNGYTPISPDEAMIAIQEERDMVVKHGVQHGYFRHHPDTDDQVLPGAIDGVETWIDLEGFDISGFEAPIQTGVLPGSRSVEDDFWEA